MAVYRYQVVSVGLWRGKVKRWNTTYHMTSPSNTSSIFSRHSSVCYPNPGDATGACSGGIASIAVYNAAGGPPISQTVYFDWQAPSTWIPFTGTKWTGVPAGTPIDASGESALVLVGHMAGLSASGKPVTTRKYIHAVPSRTAATYSDPDVSPGDVSSLGGAFGTTYMANPAGVAPSTVEALPYYLNHQRVRGRRRPKAQVAAQSFSAGVIVGAQPSASGGGTPFQPK